MFEKRFEKLKQAKSSAEFRKALDEMNRDTALELARRGVLDDEEVQGLRRLLESRLPYTLSWVVQ